MEFLPESDRDVIPDFWSLLYEASDDGDAVDNFDVRSDEDRVELKRLLAEQASSAIALIRYCQSHHETLIKDFSEDIDDKN